MATAEVTGQQTEALPWRQRLGTELSARRAESFLRKWQVVSLRFPVSDTLLMHTEVLRSPSSFD